jgi:hypothetical protein
MARDMATFNAMFVHYTACLSINIGPIGQVVDMKTRLA